MPIGQDLLNVPMGAMIRDMAFAIADSQFQLDQSSMRTAEMMGGLQSVQDRDGNQTFDDSRVFFGYEYMTVKAALLYAIFDDFLTGSLDADSIRLKSVVLDIIRELKGLTASDQTALANAKNDDPASPDLSDDITETMIRVPTRLSMMELGFTPTFYQFVDTIIEVKIAIKMTREGSIRAPPATRRATGARGSTARGAAASCLSSTADAAPATAPTPPSRLRRSMRPTLRNTPTPRRGRPCCAPSSSRSPRPRSSRSGSG